MRRRGRATRLQSQIPVTRVQSLPSVTDAKGTVRYSRLVVMRSTSAIEQPAPQQTAAPQSAPEQPASQPAPQEAAVAPPTPEQAAPKQ